MRRLELTASSAVRSCRWGGSLKMFCLRTNPTSFGNRWKKTWGAFDLSRGIFGAHCSNTDPLDRSAQAARSILVSPYGSRRGSTVSQPICASAREAHCLRSSKVGLTSGGVQCAHTCVQARTHSQALCTCMMLFSKCMFGFPRRNLTLNYPRMPRRLSQVLPLSLPLSVPLLIEYLSMSRLKSALPTLERGRGTG